VGGALDGGAEAVGEPPGTAAVVHAVARRSASARRESFV
jgi:hypothetical protein